MADAQSDSTATTAASAALAQSRETGPMVAPPSGPSRVSDVVGEGREYDIGPGVERAAEGRPYERQPNDPLYRPLRIFALDPSASKLEGAITLVNVPYEPLAPGFKGRVFQVSAHDGGNGVEYDSLDLDDRTVLLQDGRAPSPSDPLFHQQMVYAVSSLVYAAFKAALGRHLAWGFGNKCADGCTRLRLRPYAERNENAYFDKEAGELRFGYFRATRAGAAGTPPAGWVFTSLSHDIVAHEVTHALLDGLRTDFVVPSGGDVRAFHEGFADLVAIFQRFSYENVVAAAVGKARGHLEDAELLTALARQFGQTTGAGHALRTAIDAKSEAQAPATYREDLEPHQLGIVLVLAVFDAFRTVFKRKTARYLRLATNGTGELPPGGLPSDLQAILADKASRLASQFLSICIRAIDYCPPVDIEFGEFLRAVVTADHDLVPDDPWAYREALIDAFRRRGIYPRGVDFLSEDALRWRPPARPVRPIRDLSFAELKFDGDPARPAGAAELRRQARALGYTVSRPEYLEVFGLAGPGDTRLRGDEVGMPCVQSIRSSRRVGPDGQVVFDLVAEVTQRRGVTPGGGAPGFDFVGGSTIIIGPTGTIRYVISKSILNAERLERQRRYMTTESGRRLWDLRADRLVPSPQPFKLLHDGRPRAGSS